MSIKYQFVLDEENASLCLIEICWEKHFRNRSKISENEAVLKPSEDSVSEGHIELPIGENMECG